MSVAKTKSTGLNSRFIWRAGAAIWLFCAAVQLSSWQFHLTPKPLPTITILITGIIPVLVGVGCLVAARLDVPADPWFHLPLAFGVVVIIIGNATDPNDHGPDVIYGMLPMIVALVLFPTARAWPYVVAAVGGSCWLAAISQDPAPTARAIATAFVVLGTATLLRTGQSQLQRALRRNRDLAEIDGLTGVANTRRLHTRLENEFSQTRQFGLIAFDLDDFKLVNDTLGHSTGDRVLREVARAVERILKPGDMLARRGGDEFSVVAFDLPDRSLEQLRDAIELTIQRTRRELCPGIEPGASVGFTRRLPEDSIEAMLVRADQDLHEQKTASHDRRGGSRATRLVPAAATTREGDVPLLPNISEHLPRLGEKSFTEASWEMIAGCFAALALMTPLIALFSTGGDSFAPGLIAVCLTSACAAVICFFAGAKHDSRATVWIALIGTLVIATAVVLQAGDQRSAALDLLLLPAMVSFYVLGLRGGLLFAPAAIAIYAWGVSTLNYDLAVLRVVQTVAVVLWVGLMLPRVVKQVRMASEESEALSGVDPLTQLANVRRMNQRLADDLAHANATGETVTVVMIDLDDFKSVNDRYSHDHGDRTLQAVAGAIQRSVQESDLVARRGGDEFIVVIGDAERRDIARVCADIEAQIVHARATVCPNLHAGASIGFIASRPGDSVNEVLARADESEQRVKADHRADKLASELKSRAAGERLPDDFRSVA